MWRRRKERGACDPSHSPAQVSQLLHTQTAPAAFRLVRKPLSSMRAKQYQMVVVAGLMHTEIEYKPGHNAFGLAQLLHTAVSPRCSGALPPIHHLATHSAHTRLSLMAAEALVTPCFLNPTSSSLSWSSLCHKAP
ncbi:hypothetical protein GWK47_014681 [Chionoecetes opilio]|uniref:Uncharacterized protein n=1 Tax=Chionoecetes opilio TaxID=41210 RepID=A0A8J4XT10_CHIOP|nr:hypothetical protein GWK47_014681 [Chionoecetes opilio]